MRVPVCRAKLPVMVWFHGGAYMFGQGTERPWTVHENDSIVKVKIHSTCPHVRLLTRIRLCGLDLDMRPSHHPCGPCV